MTPEPFSIQVPDAAIDDLRARLANARIPEDFANDDWRYGVPSDVLARQVAYWRDEYDWRTHEAAMNAWPGFRVEIDDVPIHFLHVRGKGPAPMPLVLTHGWPWSFWDFRDAIGPLSDPGAHGGDPADAFDLVVASLPGFGWSSPLRTPGITAGRVADLWDRLMREVLGYERYAAAGGDWGALVTANIGHRFEQHLYGVHESLIGLLGFDYGSLRPGDFAPEEAGWWENVVARAPTIGSHMSVHSSDPQTLGHALNDSPVGLLAWIGERRRAWSDWSDSDFESVLPLDDLLTLVSIYWFSGSITSSMRFYWENMRAPFEPVHDRKPTVGAPTGFSVFPRDVLLVPQRIAREYANVQRWTPMPRGGHFGPSEQPALWLEDVCAFFRELRPAVR